MIGLTIPSEALKAGRLIAFLMLIASGNENRKAAGTGKKVLGWSAIVVGAILLLNELR